MVAGGSRSTLTTVQFNKLIGLVLEVFILVELFRIAVAYMKHENVIPTVLEAALVAVARKFVVFEGADELLPARRGPRRSAARRRDIVVAARPLQRVRADL